MTRNQKIEALIKKARTFSYSKIAVRDGERLSDADIFGIIKEQFGRHPAVWLALTFNRRMRRIPGVYEKIFARFLRLCLSPQTLLAGLPQSTRLRKTLAAIRRASEAPA